MERETEMEATGAAIEIAYSPGRVESHWPMRLKGSSVKPERDRRGFELSVGSRERRRESEHSQEVQRETERNRSTEQSRERKRDEKEQTLLEGEEREMEGRKSRNKTRSSSTKKSKR